MLLKYNFLFFLGQPEFGLYENEAVGNGFTVIVMEAVSLQMLISDHTLYIVFVVGETVMVAPEVAGVVIHVYVPVVEPDAVNVVDEPMQMLLDAAVTEIASIVTCTLFEVDEFPPDVVLQV